MKTRQKIRKGILLWSFFLFPATLYYFSPVLILEASATGIVNGSWIVFLLLLVSALLLGRGYCGWLCPAAGCQEAIFLARPKRVTKGDLIKWIIWVPWFGAIVVLAIRAGGYHTIDFFYQTTHGLSIGDIQGAIVYFSVLIGLIVLPAFLFGKRAFCHHLCWMAPFMIVGRQLRNRLRWPSLGLAPAADKCVHCHTCTRGCPMSLPVERMVAQQRMEHTECILCGTCVDGCEQGAVTYTWR
ncbi:MAG: 4Fe-4S binding protein [Desulfosarcinaceae bacterium]|nr:4Fe-4S binding protein [Desulfosarcinaceae bacterium]